MLCLEQAAQQPLLPLMQLQQGGQTPSQYEQTMHSRAMRRPASVWQRRAGAWQVSKAALEKCTAATPTHVIELGQASLDLGLLAEQSGLAEMGEESERCDDDAEAHVGLGA